MNPTSQTSRILGIAFLFQFFTAFTSSAIILPMATGLPASLSVPEDVSGNLIQLANNAWLMRINILGEMLTTLGIVFLGTALFITLRRQNERLALAAMGFYIIEAAMLAVSTLEAFSLLRISQEYVASGQPDDLLRSGKLAIEMMSFAYNPLHVLCFAIGGTMFYYLLDQSRLVPRAISLWGLITILPFLLGAPLTILGYEFPFLFYMPYVPFELVIGLWLFVKGVPDAAAS